jgi:glycosyltransferase involved in cell wall biosynthesis
MDGCDDGTSEIVLQMAKQYSRLVPLVYPNRLGKGGALIEGFQHAKGDYLVMLDADGPTSPEDLYRLVEEAKSYDLVIGSRYMKDSKILVKEPLPRIFLSRAFNILVRLMFRRLRRLRDTQCGVKVLRRDVLEKIGKYLFITDLVFDVNLIYLTLLNGFKVKEIGITWKHNEMGSKIGRSYLKVSIKMLLSLLRLRIYFSKLNRSLESKLTQQLLRIIYERL